MTPDELATALEGSEGTDHRLNSLVHMIFYNPPILVHGEGQFMRRPCWYVPARRLYLERGRPDDRLNWEFATSAFRQFADNVDYTASVEASYRVFDDRLSGVVHLRDNFASEPGGPQWPKHEAIYWDDDDRGPVDAAGSGRTRARALAACLVRASRFARLDPDDLLIEPYGVNPANHRPPADEGAA